jgi:hypothetical protein
MAAMRVAPLADKEAFRPDEVLFNLIEQFELLAGELAGDRVGSGSSSAGSMRMGLGMLLTALALIKVDY